MGSPYRHNALPWEAAPDREIVRFEGLMRRARQRGRLLALAVVASLAALTLSPMLVRAPDLRPPTRDLAVVRPSFWSPARILYPVTAPALPAPWGPPCNVTREACDF